MLKRNHKLLAFLLLMTLVPAARAQIRRPGMMPASRPVDPVRELFRPVVAPATQSTVSVQCKGKRVALGTVVDGSGLVLTKASELDGPATCKLADGRETPATVLGIAHDDDLALLRVEARDLVAVKWGDARKAEVGQWVATAGTSGPPVAVGVISVGRRRIPPRSGILGVSLLDGATGVRVAQVLPDSGAEKAGVQVDDIILRVGGKVVGTRDELTVAMQWFAMGEHVKLSVKRGEREMELTVTLGSRLPTPTTRRADQNLTAGPLSARNTGFPAVLQHDTVLRPEDCGGPLVDLDGHVLGINIARAGRTETYALPADVIEAVLPDLKSGKLAPATGPVTAPTTRPAPTSRDGSR